MESLGVVLDASVARSRFLSDSDLIIIRKAKRLLLEITPEDIAQLSLPHENIYNLPKSTARYKNVDNRGGPASEGKSWGVNSHATHASGGSPPEITAIELRVDLQSALDRRPIDPEQVLALYIRLSAMMNR